MSIECEDRNVVNIREKALAVLSVFLCNSIKVEGFAAVNFGDYLILELTCGLYLLSENFRMNEVVHSDTAALILIHICRTYASLGSTDVLTASESL